MDLQEKQLPQLPIGIETFSEIIREGYFYVDKTNLIWELAHQGKFLFLSRPRRFGKSLTLTTLESYFRAEKECFRGLKLERLQQESGREWVEYPVINLYISSPSQRGEAALRALIDQGLDFVARRYGIEPEGTADMRLAHLIVSLHEKFQRPVVILIDEYDHPLLDTMEPKDKELHEQYLQILRGLYMNFKRLDRYLRFVMLTGVARFSGLSLFSGLNNIDDITLNERYATLCGVTQAELEDHLEGFIDRLAAKLGLDRGKATDLLRRRYDGYRFTPEGEHVYNPFCLLMALKNLSLRNYWMGTGTPQVLDYILPEHRIDLPTLERGVPVHLNDLGRILGRDGSTAPFLFQTGYLSIVQVLSHDYVLMALPNAEVRNTLAVLMQYDLLGRTRSGMAVFKLLHELKDALHAGDVAGFMDRLTPILAAVATGNEPKDSLIHESHFRNTFYVVFKLLEEEVAIELPSALGRSDCEVEARHHIYIFELKLQGEDGGGQTPRRALRQIHDRRYGRRHETNGKPIVCVGAVFDNEGSCQWEQMPYEALGDLPELPT